MKHGCRLGSAEEVSSQVRLVISMGLKDRDGTNGTLQRLKRVDLYAQDGR